MNIEESNADFSQEDIAKIQQDLVDPRTISKATDLEGRSKVAAEITQAKLQKEKLPENISEKEQVYSEAVEKARAIYEIEYKKDDELLVRMKSLIVKAKNLVGVDDKKAMDLEKEIEDLGNQRVKIYAQTTKLNREIEDLKREHADAPDPKELLAAYYEKAANTPLTNEQKRDLLKPEVISNLSTEQYIALWKRLNPHFLSHVTRQGFRDHNAMMYHSAGMNEFHEGFSGVMEDNGVLRPPMAIEALRTRDDKSVKKWMGDWVLGEENEDEARKKLNSLVNFSLGSAPQYPDKTAVHFAAQLVADGHYGGERGNEVFFLYPSDVIASQYDFAFNGWEKDFTKPQSETKWNDVFVWPHTVENSGISVDSGMVFLPKNTPVDSKTGSKYLSEMKTIDGEEKKTMVEDNELVDKFVNWAVSLNNESSDLKKAFEAYLEEKNYYSQLELQKAFVNDISKELIRLGFKGDAISKLANKLFGEMHHRNQTEKFSKENFESMAKDTGSHYKRAENVVSSEEYWEALFKEKPELKPKHVVYYDGDPSRAVLEFQNEHGIGKANTSEEDGQLLGFDDRHVVDMENDPRANQGLEELKETASRIIEEHYAELTPEHA